MTTIKIRWTVEELENVMTLYNTQKVYRATSESGPWTTEITGPATRVPLVAGVTSYLFDDTAGSTAYFYAISYYHSVSGLESSLSEPIRGNSCGYVTIADVRAEGITETIADDARVAWAIERASAYIDTVTGQWFEPRTRTFRLDGARGDAVSFGVPIIAITEFLYDGDGIDRTVDDGQIYIYNRHLTMGLTSPDDRANPRISWQDGDTRDDLGFYAYQKRFESGFNRVQVTGVFGYTELGRNETPGETAAGSQVPLSYGQTPLLIQQACLRLVMKYLYPLAGGEGEDISMRRRLTSESTRDQSYSLAAPSSGDAAYGLSGDVEVDRILSMFMAPVMMGLA